MNIKSKDLKSLNINMFVYSKPHLYILNYQYTSTHAHPTLTYTHMCAYVCII